MKKLTAGEWLAVIGTLLAASLLLALWFIYLRPESGPAIVYADSKDCSVINGTAYDRATIDLGDYQTVVVPDDAIVEASDDPSTITILMRKTLDYRGRPPQPMTIVRGRHLMGCAWAEKEGTLRIATYGEWDSFYQGGAHMNLTVRVPKAVTVERDATLSGTLSIARPRHAGSRSFFRGEDLDGCYWYGGSGTNAAWTAIESTPDLEYAAQF